MVQVFDFVDKSGGFGGVAAVYDGQKVRSPTLVVVRSLTVVVLSRPNQNCYTPKRLGAPFVGDAHTFEIILPDDDSEGDAPRKGREGRAFKVSFRKVRRVAVDFPTRYSSC